MFEWLSGKATLRRGGGLLLLDLKFDRVLAESLDICLPRSVTVCRISGHLQRFQSDMKLEVVLKRREL